MGAAPLIGPAYIDPNTGFQIFSSLGPLWGMILALLAAMLWPFIQGGRWIRRTFKRPPAAILLVFFSLAVVTLVLIFHFNRNLPGARNVARVIVLGMDGMDPDLVEEFMSQGKLPNFKRLKDQGDFARLGTVLPPQSPVAWSSFATGLNPGGHGLFDFLWRHTEDYMPDLALAEFKPPKKIKISGLEIPLGRPHFENRRGGSAFWTLTSQARIPTTVIHCPLTFPPERVSDVMLSGMGVPDVRGTQGTFSFYSDDTPSGKTQGGLRIAVRIVEGVIDTVFKGPWIGQGKEAEVPLKIKIDPGHQRILLRWNGEEEALPRGEWSRWLRVRFQVGSGTLEGMTRLFLKSLSPHFELYASPFNFTPEKPAHPISYPHRYAERLKQAIGDFHTLGMPHDTWALNEGVMSEDMFLEQSRTILQEEMAMLKKELPRFKRGLFVFVIETPDRIQHMFWRARDTRSPLYTKEFAERYGHVIPDIYQKMDEVLRYVMGFVGDNTTLVVMSDHGFKSFRRAVHLNSWLRENGYLVYAGPSAGKEFFQEVDWGRSKAYAVGLGSIYLNLAGREKHGIVEAGPQADQLKREIAGKLKQFKDPRYGNSIVREVYPSESIFEGPRMGEAPDLLVAFDDGYRASWQTALGAAPKEWVEDNLKKWSGDHIMDAPLVPGILFTNRKLNERNPTLYDLAPTILGLFGLEIPKDLKGRKLLSHS